MDVKTAFLNGELEEEIYMEQPESFATPGNKRKVCRLVKTLYGLKQAPKEWHKKFDKVILSNSFKINECDKYIYFKNTPNGFVIVSVYVDDMLILGSDEMIESTKKMIKSNFEFKDMGVMDVILGIKVIQSSDGLILSQSHYIEKILEKFKKYNIKPMRTPLEVTNHLKKNKGESVSQLEYSRIMGSIMYVMNCTRSDIANAVSRLSRYTHNPSREHWKAIIRLLGYLMHTKDFGLHYRKYPAVLEGYIDANWISGSKNTKSTSGYVLTLAGGAVS